MSACQLHYQDSQPHKKMRLMMPTQLLQLSQLMAI